MCWDQIVIRGIPLENPAQMGLAEHDDGVEGFATNRSDQPLDVTVLQSYRMHEVDETRVWIRITHPFHPLRNQAFRFVVRKQLWGEERVTFLGPEGEACSVPANWTGRSDERRRCNVKRISSLVSPIIRP